MTNPELARRTEIMGLRMADGQGLAALVAAAATAAVVGVLVESGRVGTHNCGEREG